MSGHFRVDREVLQDAIKQMGDFDTHVEDLLAQIDSRIGQLHVKWTGEAAAAQKTAHDQWTDAAHDMRTALTELQTAAHIAHTNYSGAVRANTEMWP